MIDLVVLALADVSVGRLVACDVELTELLPALAGVLVDGVETGPSPVRIMVRTPAGAMATCPDRGQESEWEHSRYVRHVADEAIGGRPAMIDISVRRLYCENPGCSRTTFVEQVPGLTARYQRRPPALQQVVAAVATALSGRAGTRLLVHLHQVLSWSSTLTCRLRIPLPDREVPEVLGSDDFALRQGHRYATIIIDAVSRDRIDVLPDRKAETVTGCLRAHPGIEVVCRDGSAGYAQAVLRHVRRSLGARWRPDECRPGGWRGGRPARRVPGARRRAHGPGSRGRIRRG
ncbi:transposase [Streptomyces hirsutus]|uniref:transposase n=1 Tax=Streptomyces hirsutus TaxID=35620 RepID=UPI0033A2EDA6